MQICTRNLKTFTMNTVAVQIKILNIYIYIYILRPKPPELNRVRVITSSAQLDSKGPKPLATTKISYLGHLLPRDIKKTQANRVWRSMFSYYFNK